MSTFLRFSCTGAAVSVVINDVGRATGIQDAAPFSDHPWIWWGLAAYWAVVAVCALGDWSIGRRA